MTANDNNHRGLLPAGLADLLPPDAAREAGAIGIAIERFAAFGYELCDIIDVLEQFRFEIYRLNGNKVSRDYRSVVCENLLASRARPPKIET